MIRLYLIILSAFLLASCTSNPASSENEPKIQDEVNKLKKDLPLVTILEQAHMKKEFMKKGNVSFDIKLEFGGKQRLDGTITLSADSKNGKIKQKDGKIILFNDNQVYCTDGMNEKSARFAAYTWSYFFMFPYKLSDEGTNWKPYSNGKLKGELFDAQKLTFDSGIGDAPDDWYIVYSDKDSYLINTAAYIVTAGNSREEAEKDPHAIEYCDYKKIEGIPVATTWRFWAWQPDEGLTDELGNAQISNLKFLKTSEDFYLPKEGLVLVE